MYEQTRQSVRYTKTSLWCCSLQNKPHWEYQMCSNLARRALAKVFSSVSKSWQTQITFNSEINRALSVDYNRNLNT